MSLGVYDLDIKHTLSDDPGLLIVMLYEKVKTRVKDLVGIKNQQLAEILDDWGIPYLDLSEYRCPNIYRLKALYGGTVCHFHEREVPDRSILRCAEQMCLNM